MSCILPPSGTHYVSTPDIRGTVDILSTSLSVIVLSTWSVLHLSVPIQTKPRTKQEWLTRWIFRLSIRLTWMLIAIAGPELLVGRSLMQLARARRSKKELSNFIQLDKVDWSLGHSFFADMKGFEVTFSEGVTEPGYGLGSDSTIWSRMTARTSRVASMIGAGLAKFTMELQPVDNMDHYSYHSRTGNGQQAQTRDGSNRPLPLKTWDSADTGKTYVHTPDGIDHYSIRQADDYIKDNNASDIECNHCRTNSHMTTSLRPSYEALTNLGVSRLSATNARQQIDGRMLGPVLWRPDAANFETVVRAEKLANTMKWSPKDLATLEANLYAFQGTSWRLNAAQLAEVRSLGIIKTLPSISNEDLEDKGSSNGFLKLVALFQIVWQLIDIITRKAQDLPIAPLEILALALAMCALITSVCLWSKPQDVKTTFRFPADRRPTVEDIISIALKGDVPGDSPLKRGPLHNQFYDSGFRGRSPEDDWYLVFGLLIGSAVFGSLHFLSWNHPFPTKTERLLWHVAAIASLVVPWLAALVYLVTHAYVLPFIRAMTPGTIKRMVLVNVLVTFGIATQAFYVLVRLYVAAECVRSLFFLDPKAFQSTWTVDLPHFR